MGVPVTDSKSITLFHLAWGQVHGIHIGKIIKNGGSRYEIKKINIVPGRGGRIRNIEVTQLTGKELIQKT